MTPEDIRQALIREDRVFCERNYYTKTGYACFEGCCRDFDMTLDDVIDFICECGYLGDIHIQRLQ